MLNITGTYTDHYQLTMAQVYFLTGQKEQRAVFDYFFRASPFNGGYAIFAGLEDLLDILEQFHFDEEDIEYLRSKNLHPDFINYLKQLKFSGTVYSSLEGDLVFPTRPIVTIEANLIEAQIIETLLLNILNFQTLIATKARRIRHAAGNRVLAEFGLRRAQGLGGYWASRAAAIGGFDSTSNVRASRDFEIPISGTMAHSFIQSHDSELQAFSNYAQLCPDNCILLVDTYNTLQSGVPNAIKVAKEMEKRGHKLKGIRLDSGDLAWLAKKSRAMLDEAGLPYVTIAASNQLDEFVIENLLRQEAPIDVFGVGTNLVVGAPDSALDGAYKLVVLNHKPRIKLSDTPIKVTIPYHKQVYRVIERDGMYQGADVIALKEEHDIYAMHHPSESFKSLFIQSYEKVPLLYKVMERGKRLQPKKSLADITQSSRQCFDKLPMEYKRFINPHIYKIGLTSELKKRRNELISMYREDSL